MPRRIPQVQDDYLVGNDGQPIVEVGSAAWFDWLSAHDTKSFSYQTAYGPVTARREQKRNGWYWYVYRNHGGKLRKAYLGKSDEMTVAHLRERVAALLPTTANEPRAHLYLLGSLLLSVGTQQITIVSAKAALLLAYLATHELPQSREQVIALLWPESTATAGRKNLRNLLWSLRTLATIPLIEGLERLALAPSVWVDVQQFEQLSHDLHQSDSHSSVDELRPLLATVYRGPLLDGIAIDDAPELDLWLGSERERLQQAYLAALGRLVATYRAAGRWREVLTVARAGLARDPFQETMHQAVIEAHGYLGERSEALRQYESLRGLLDRELGVEPLPETEQLRTAILRRTFQPPGPASPVQRTRAQREAHTPYVGRRAELAALDNAWERVQRGTAQVVLLLGEAGIGKSRLWQTWAARVPETSFILEARCLETTRSLPFAPLVESLRGFLPVALPELVRGRAQTPAWLADVSRLLPELRDTLNHLPPPPPLAPAEEQRRIFEALVQSLHLVADRPVILFVDDLHWVDRATLDWLGYLLQRAHDKPLLFVGAYRAEEISLPFTKLVGSWMRTEVAQRLSLERLNRAETEALVTALGGDLGQVDSLYGRSAGNPYFLRELMQGPADRVPAALADLIGARLDDLPEVARHVIQAAAVLQPYSDFAALCRTSARSESETLDAIELLIQRGLLVEHGAGLAFNHPLIAHVVDDKLSGVRRSMLHGRAAEAWLAVAGGHGEELAGRLAIHYREAGDTARAAHYAERAGDQALALGASVEAGQFYELALALEPTSARSYGKGLAHYWQGDLQEAQVAFRTAFDTAIHDGDWPIAGRACLELARTARASGQSADVLRWVTLGRSYLADTDDPTAAAMAAYLLGTGMRNSGQSLRDAEAHLRDALAAAETAQASALLPGILFELGNVRAQRGDLPTALAYFMATIDVAERNNDLVHIVIGHNNAAYHATLIGDLASAHQHIETGMRFVEERGMGLSREWLYSTRGEIALAEGAWETAAVWFERGISEAERNDNAALLVGYRANRARVVWGRGDATLALAMMNAARVEAAALHDDYLVCQIELWLAEWQCASDPAAAAASLARANTILAGREYALLQARSEKLRDALLPLES